MIALDSSALIAIGLREPDWEDCFRAVARERDFVMSAVNLAETLIVASRREVLADMQSYLAELSIKIVPADEPAAHRAVAIYEQWGKGNHPAKLNFCDCFAYDAARQFGCPLLFIGNDFSQTDIARVL